MTYKVYKRGNFIIVESSNGRDIWETPVNEMEILRATNISPLYNFFSKGDSILSNIALSFLIL
jgi:hypothetical protein